MTTPYCGACSQACAFCHGTYDKLRAENERLRAALGQVVELCEVEFYDTVESVARKALSGPSEGDPR
jgi:hypothetical protein